MAFDWKTCFQAPACPKEQYPMTALTKTGLITLVIAAVTCGIWLNRAAWSNRRLIWQLQAAMVAGGVGFVVGRVSAPGQKR